jgi:hypothetical protein
LYCALRRHARLHLNGDLCFYPSKKPFAALNRALFERPFQKSFLKPFALSFRSFSGFM